MSSETCKRAAGSALRRWDKFNESPAQNRLIADNERLWRLARDLSRGLENLLPDSQAPAHIAEIAARTPIRPQAARICSSITALTGTYNGGPLHREPWRRLTATHRDGSGRSIRVALVIGEPVYGRWQPGETGILARAAIGYKWIARNLGEPA
jgi:hypothetical protein